MRAAKCVGVFQQRLCLVKISHFHVKEIFMSRSEELHVPLWDEKML